MSLAAVCKAVRNTLQAEFNLNADSCEVGFDGQPKPSAGEKYFAVHPLGWTGLPQDWDLGEEYQMAVTVTLRLGFAPRDRWGIAVWLAEDEGMETLIRQVITVIHHNQTLRLLAVNLQKAPGGGNILTPLQFIRVDAPVMRDYDWFTAVAPENRNQTDQCGVSQTIVFGKCQRVQSIPDME